MICNEWMPLTLEPGFVSMASLGIPEAVAPVPQCRHKCDDQTMIYKGAVALAGGFEDNIGPTLASTSQYHVFTVPNWDAGTAYYITATSAGGKAANIDPLSPGAAIVWGANGSNLVAYPGVISWRIDPDGKAYAAPSVPTNTLSLDGLTLYYTRYTTP